MTNGKNKIVAKNRFLPNLGLRFQIWRLHSIWSWKGAAISSLSLRGRLKIGISNCRLQLKKTFEEKNINFALVTVSKKNKTNCLILGLHFSSLNLTIQRIPTHVPYHPHQHWHPPPLHHNQNHHHHHCNRHPHLLIIIKYNHHHLACWLPQVNKASPLSLSSPSS